MIRIPVLTSSVIVLICTTLTGGCSARKDTPPSKSDAKASKKAEDHHGEHGTGPHGGAVADWGGGKYHVEFTVDHDKQEATVYILGSDEKTPVPIKAKDGELLLTIKEPAFQAVLKANPQKGDSDGLASAFTGKHKNLGIVREFAGTISGEVGGTPFVGDFREESPKK